MIKQIRTLSGHVTPFPLITVDNKTNPDVVGTRHAVSVNNRFIDNKTNSDVVGTRHAVSANNRSIDDKTNLDIVGTQHAVTVNNRSIFYKIVNLSDTPY